MLASASSVLQFHLCNTMPSTEVSCFSLSFFFFFCDTEVCTQDLKLARQAPSALFALVIFYIGSWSFYLHLPNNCLSCFHPSTFARPPLNHSYLLTHENARSSLMCPLLGSPQGRS
jgi:hypothetical protein